MILKAFSEDYFKRLKNIRKHKIIFFNGCFDIMHVGHLAMINKIKGYAEMLWPSGNYKIICGLNSDESVKLQDKKHPLINSEKDRALFLEHLDVDVIIFDEKDPSALLMSLVPDVVAKGLEYERKMYPERNFLIKSDIEVKYIRMEEGYSTSNAYNKIKSYVLDEIKERLNET